MGSAELPHYPNLGPETALDRASSKRGDREWVAAQLARADTKFLVLDNLKAVVEGEADGVASAIRWFSSEDLGSLNLDPTKSLFLGLDGAGAAHFVLPLSVAERNCTFDPGNLLTPSVELRSLALSGGLPPGDLSLIGEARALCYWHDTHKCCGKCGSYANVRDGGWRLKCWSCGHNQFPRCDPAVIMAITDGERCLLGHEHRFPENLYSVLAGFVEPGETIECAVRREVKEESGIEVGTVDYVASQPWPFPASLMIACRGEALSTEIVRDEEEIADVRWFDRAAVRMMVEGSHPDGLKIPPGLSIASMLIRQFADG